MQTYRIWVLHRIIKFSRYSPETFGHIAPRIIFFGWENGRTTIYLLHIYSGALQASLDDLSNDLQKSHQERLQSDESLQKKIEDRNSLPVFHMQGDIMTAIYDNPVTIIRGNTGCGKTTQVSIQCSHRPICYKILHYGKVLRYFLHVLLDSYNVIGKVNIWV